MKPHLTSQANNHLKAKRRQRINHTKVIAFGIVAITLGIVFSVLDNAFAAGVSLLSNTTELTVASSIDNQLIAGMLVITLSVVALVSAGLWRGVARELGQNNHTDLIAHLRK